ncbi:uncharacterized protein LOC101856350 [Aplysia californica]|uniref:Uncharacterized protein LOC101856350 n=1 Tax=Aplysia californica TaxID=6500 RepID=A0ABM0JT41_APLCA|nr:uncharacterized protein LOC101856350 [Aplysia californica]
MDLLKRICCCCRHQSLYFANANAAVLLFLAAVAYTIAMATNWWFTMPPHSFYGLWSVTFCDFLQCQLIPASGDSPNWYLAVQVLSVLGYIFLILAVVAVIFLLVTNSHPSKVLCVQLSKASGLCVLSATFMSMAIIVFYTNLLMESSPKYRPNISYSSGAVCLACVLELCAAALLNKKV